MHSQRFRWGFALLLFAFAWLPAGCGSRANNEGAAKKPAARPTIVFMTDFGTANDAVAICKAVIIGIMPDVRIWTSLIR